MATLRGSLGRSAANRVESAAAADSGQSGAMATLRGSSLFRGAANRVESAAKRASDGMARLSKAVAGGAAGGAAVGVAVAAAEGLALNGMGFTALGPAAGSYAAVWMSSTTLANGVGVSVGSTYAALQSAAMGGGAILGGPVVIAMAAMGGAAGAYYYHTRDGGGNAPTEDPAPADDSTQDFEELSSEEDATEEEQQIDKCLALQGPEVARI